MAELIGNKGEVETFSPRCPNVTSGLFCIVHNLVVERFTEAKFQPAAFQRFIVHCIQGPSSPIAPSDPQPRDQFLGVGQKVSMATCTSPPKSKEWRLCAWRRPRQELRVLISARRSEDPKP